MIARLNKWIRGADALAFRARMKKLGARLHGDQRGNVMLLYVAAAMLLVGMLWAIIGTGARMVQKETIQSSADAAAFSAAVIKAKGLNIIAFCNLLMALLLAIIMIMRLIKGALMIALGVCIAACFDIFGGEVLCALAPEVESAYNWYSNLVAQVEPRIMDAMRGLAKVERAVNKTFPALSLVEAYRVGTNQQYQKNFGKGSLITVTWPLPVGADMSLPTKDGTWDDLCTEARKEIGQLVEIALSKIGLGPVAGIIGSGISMLMGPLQGVLCGSGGGNSNVMIDTQEKAYTCSDCAGAEKSTWTGTQVIRNPDGTFKQFIAGQTCKTDGFPAPFCGGGNPSFLRCSDGKEMKAVNLVECLVKKKKPDSVGGDISNKPVPLLIADDWQQRKNVRAFTLLTDANMDARRASVNVGVRASDRGSNPMLNQLLGTAQAEFYAFNGPGHDDLWHMDWRARLVRFTFSNGSTDGSGGEGDAAGDVPAGSASTVGNKIKDFVMNDGASALADQFMLH
jgi:hypothetical protein